MKNLILLAAFFLFVNKITYAQPGSLDSSFGVNGIVTSSLGTTTCTAIQSSGKILLAGATGISRYNPEGTLDNTFGINGTGTVSNDFAIVSMAIQSNDKFVVAGTIAGDFVVARYNSNGTPDNTFNGTGRQTTDFANTFDLAVFVLIQNDEKIILRGVTGSNIYIAEDAVLIRYNTDGSLDNSFNGNGKLNLNCRGEQLPGVNSVAIQTDGKIITVGGVQNENSPSNTSDLAVLRFNTDGTPDNSFNGGGLKRIDFGSYDLGESIAIKSDGKLVVTGYFHIDPAETLFTSLATINPDGTSDNSFSDDGKLVIDLSKIGDYSSPYSLAIQNDGKILIGGFANTNTQEISTFVIARFFANGNFDSTFGDKGIQRTHGRYHINQLLIFNNKLYAVQYPIGLARYNLESSSNINVIISSPANNSVFKAPASFTITASVFNQTAPITKINFYNGNILVHSDNTSPYAYNVTNASAGNYNLVAKAITNAGDTITSQKVIVKVIPPQPPVISFISPTHDTSYISPVLIKLEATATDNQDGGAISKVEFFNGNLLLGTTTTAPYTFNWTNAAVGVYTIIAKATDNTGLTDTAVIHITIKAAKPTFGYNVNGTFVANINNGVLDSSETASVIFCESGQYTTSDNFHSNLSNLYNITVVKNGGSLYFDGFNVARDVVITAPEFNASSGSHTVTLANANIGGTVIQTITPFTDLNHNSILDPTDTVGDPVVITYALTPKPTWYKDEDNDQHASTSLKSCTSPGTGWTLNVLPIDDCNDNDPASCNIPQPFSVVLSAPTNNAVYAAPATINFLATAKDTTGIIKKIDFYNGGTLINTERYEKYEWTWKNVPAGDYTLIAQATDDHGLKATSSQVHIKVITNQPPTVTIISPADGAVFANPATVTISADAHDADGKINKVDFYNGTTLMHTEKYASYSWTSKNLPPGDYTIIAKATDNWGSESTSIPIHFSVTGTPNCTLSNQPTFSFKLNQTKLANINNGIADASETGNVTICDGEKYSIAGFNNSSSFDLINISYSSQGGVLLFNGALPKDTVITGSGFIAIQGKYSVSLGNADISGTVVETIIPFSDINNNKILDNSDCKGDPITITYVVNAKPVWYLDADGDHHAIKTTRSCSSPGTGWTKDQLPMDDCNDNDVLNTGPKFGFAVDTISVFNTNNLLSDSSENATIIVCPGGKYSISSIFQSSGNNLYKINSQQGGSTVIVDDNLPTNGVITAAQFDSLAGDHILTLANPSVQGQLVQTITPFTDLNNNGILDAADCAGDPIKITYVVNNLVTWYKDADGDKYASQSLVACTSPGLGWTTTQLPIADPDDNNPNIIPVLPTFGYKFNGKNVANINNGKADPGESASVVVCNGGKYSTSGHFHSSPSNLYKIIGGMSGGNLLLFNGGLPVNDIVLTAAQLSATAGTYTITLFSTSQNGTYYQKVTPFLDLNNNGSFDDGDLKGDPINFVYTANVCTSSSAVASKKPNTATNIYPISNAVDIKVSPNPATNLLTLSSKGLQRNTPSIISIVSSSGVTMKTIKTADINQTISLNVSSLTSGVYTLKIINGNQVMYKKFVKL